MSNNPLNMDTKQEMLVSFYSIYDLDVGLYHLIKDKYLDEKVFNKELFRDDMTNRQILELLYKRKAINPLYILANKDISQKDLDDYYKQFMDQEFDYIFDKCVYTEIMNFIRVLIQDKTIIPSIIYYDKNQLKALQSESELQGIRFIDIDTIINSKENYIKYDFVYIGNLNELLYLTKLLSTNIFISSHGYNLNEDNSNFDTNNKILQAFMGLNRNNDLGLYEPYNFSKLDKRDKLIKALENGEIDINRYTEPGIPELIEDEDDNLQYEQSNTNLFSDDNK